MIRAFVGLFIYDFYLNSFSAKIIVTIKMVIIELYYLLSQN